MKIETTGFGVNQTEGIEMSCFENVNKYSKGDLDDPNMITLYAQGNNSWHVAKNQYGNNICFVRTQGGLLEVPYIDEPDENLGLWDQFLPDGITKEEFIEKVAGYEIWD